MFRLHQIGIAHTIFCGFIGLSACQQREAVESGASSPPPKEVAGSKEPLGTEAEQPARMLEVGDTIPNLELTAHTGQRISLSELRGQPVVVYFYPKDDTPGCTIEAQEIRDLWTDLKESNVMVLGVSTDDNVSHRDFASKYELPFLLLPDSDHEIANAFGVPLKNGRASRVTFVFDGAGKLIKVFPEVKPRGHGAEVLAAVRAIGS